MLTANLMVQVGLDNGALSTVVAICYDGTDQSPPNLPVGFQENLVYYTGPILVDGTVQIAPLCLTWLQTPDA